MRQFYSNLALLFFLLLAFPVSAHLDSVKVYIPFYGNMNDWSGWNNQGNSINPTYTKDRNGAADRALLLSGSGNHMDVPTKSILNPKYTYAQWLRLDQKPDSSGFVVFQLGDSTCFLTLSIYPGSGDSVILDYSFGKEGQDSTLLFGVLMPVKSWNHLAIMRSTDSVYCFYNLFFRAEKYTPGNVCISGQSLRYGKNLKGTQEFKGAIDEIRVYSENIEPSFLFDFYIAEKLGLGSPETNLVKLYPNPGRGKVILESEWPMRVLEIYNSRGEKVLYRLLTNVKHLELTLSLAPGVYFVFVEHENNVLSSEQLLISAVP